MSQPQDPNNVHASTIDPQVFHSFQPNDAQFSPLMGSSHSDPSLSVGPTHINPQQLSNMYQSELEHANNLPVSMQMSMSALSGPSADMNRMEMAPPQTHPDPSAAPALLSTDFATHSSFAADHGMSHMENVDINHSLLSSPSTTTCSNNPSHASSPSLNGVATSYMIGSSSLASALNESGLSRSRSGSSASPSLLTAASSEVGLSSGGSGPPTSDPSFTFPPGHERTFASSKESSPDSSGDPHLLVLGDMLKK